MADGTERLCRAVYGRSATARDYLGGSEARMLHDAADRLDDAICALRILSEGAVFLTPEAAVSWARGIALSALEEIERGE